MNTYTPKVLDLIHNYEITKQETNRDNIALIDGDIFLYSVCFAKKQTQEQIDQMGDQLERTLQDVINELNNYLISTLIATNCVYYKGFLSGRSFRKDIAKISEYKAGRSTEKPKYFSEIRNYLKEVWNFQEDSTTYYEADDLICSYNKVYSNKGYTPIIISIDKDLDQIPGLHYNPRKKEFNDISIGYAEYFLWYQAIIGDTADNIKGIEGTGAVGAKKILQGSYIDNTLQAYINKYGLRKGINNFTENFNLVHLCDDYSEILEPDYIKNVVNIIDNVVEVKFE
jgi:5'-3' exonuclease